MYLSLIYCISIYLFEFGPKISLTGVS